MSDRLRTEGLGTRSENKFTVRHARIRVLSGPDAGSIAEPKDGKITVGTAEGVTLRLQDTTVSRFHLDCELTPSGVVVRDLGSRNGTQLQGVLLREAVLRKSCELELGRTKIRIELGDNTIEVPTAERSSFGRLLGNSLAMRAVYSALERAAPTTVPVLITGESGTGKELAARAVHDASPRAKQPFEIVDCGGLPPTLAESELFGHEKGSFTGANSDRAGAFERADGGTLFLDELGELPLELQPKFLRALGEGEVRRVGSARTRKVNVRVVAATNRDLRREINDGRFRSDLFYRLAVVQVHMPPLRERLDDLATLVPALLETIAKERNVDTKIALDETFWSTIEKHRFPGNVRELRNYLEQWAILRVPPPIDPSNQTPTADTPLQGFTELEAMPLRMAKAELLERFERHYVTNLLEKTGGNVAEAARRAGVDRVTLFRTIRRYGLREEE